MTAFMEFMDTAVVVPESAPGGLSVRGYLAAVRRGAVVVDVRTQPERSAAGTLPGALAVAPEHIVTRLDPASSGRLARAADTGCEWVLISADGDVAAMVSHTLHALGVTGAAHLPGGYRELRRRGLVGAADFAEHLRREGEAIAGH